MPRKNPLGEREVEICKRLASYRRSVTGLSRVMFAHKAGVDSSIIARYEHARVPLRYVHAWRLIRCYAINPVWLATGDGSNWSRVGLLVPAPEKIHNGSAGLFSEVFSETLNQLISEATKADAPTPAISSSELRIRSEWAFQKRLEDWLNQLADQPSIEFAEQLRRAGEKLFVGFPKDNPEAAANRQQLRQEDLNADVKLRLYGFSGLTKTATTVRDDDMQGKWPSLKKQLQAATEKTGKSALAKFLKVDLTRVSQWLTDAKSQREPGAEYALQMQDWLNRQT